MEKIFTVEEANRTLPLVGRIVDDLVRDHARWEDKVREFELATVGASPDHPDAIADLLQIEAQRLARDRCDRSAPDGCSLRKRWLAAAPGIFKNKPHGRRQLTQPPPVKMREAASQSGFRSADIISYAG